jgi:ABC-2 type transport system ATP-binding protein
MRTLSKGLTQKVALAQALLHDPKLLILDEPFSGLDPLGRREVREVILEEKSKNKTIFICTHVLSDVELLCDRASVLSKGELKGIVNLGPALTDRFTLITVSPNGSETQQVCNNQEQLQSELKKHLSLNSSIVSVEKISKSLEESFVELVNK